MAMNLAELERVVESLQDRVGTPVQGIWQPARDRVVVGLSDGTLLLLVPRGPHARMHTVTRRPRNPPKPFSFQGACRAHLRGPLTALTCAGDDRIVHLDIGPHRLVLRLTGRSGGLWLVRGDEVIAAYDGPAPSSLPSLPSLVPRDTPPRFTPAEGETWDEAARRFLGQQEAAARLHERRVGLRRGLRRALERAQRLRANLDSDLERASKAPLLRAQADALAANLHLVERGAERVRLPTWDGSGGEIEVELDPAKPASATMEVLYGRARRLDRVGDKVLERYEEVEEQIVALQEALSRVEDADRDELRQLEKLVPRSERRSSGRAAEDEVPWHTWLGPAGERVLVGRNERGNRRLTFQVARGDDYWLHLRERPGAHVIVPMVRGRTPSLELLLAAAQIVVTTAKIPEGRSADVQYTRVRHVRAIPGEVARVRVAEEKVLHVRRDPSVLVGWERE